LGHPRRGAKNIKLFKCVLKNFDSGFEFGEDRLPVFSFFILDDKHRRLITIIAICVANF